MNTPLKIFITYSHKNRAEKDELKTSLSVMEKKKEIKIWHDNEMLPGDKWREKITNKLNESDILLYLTSADSLSSKNCNEELAEALERYKKVIPIILEDCDWKAHQLSGFQALPDDGKPIKRWRPRGAGWQNVVKSIRKTVQVMQRAIAEPAELLFQQANFLLMIRQLGQAIEAYWILTMFNPDYADAYYNRGLAYFYEGDYDRAIADFDKAIELKPDDAVAYNNRGNAYADKGKYDRAIADFDKAIELKPDDAVAYNNRGAAYFKKGDHDQAIADFNKATDIDLDDAVAYNNRGNAYADKGGYDEAISDFNKAIALKPYLAEAYCNRGSAYAQKSEV